MIVIIDYKMGNIGSIHNMLNKVGVESKISSNPDEIESAEKLILPGIGAFDKGMENLQKLGLLEVINHKVLTQKVPVLGICLGMQLMTQKSEEGIINGFGWVDAETRKFKFDPQEGLKVPHIGWNTISTTPHNSEIANTLHINNDDRFYFVHSYYVHCSEQSIELTNTHFGGPFCSAFVKGNIIGVQFHPEKSHKYGMKLLKGFSEMYCYA